MPMCREPRRPRRSRTRRRSRLTSRIFNAWPDPRRRRWSESASTSHAVVVSVSDSVTASTDPVWVQRSRLTAPRSPSPTPRTVRRPVPSGRITATVLRSPPSAAVWTASHCPSGDQRTADTRSSPVSIDHSAPVRRRCSRTAGRPSPSQTNAMIVPSGRGWATSSAWR